MSKFHQDLQGRLALLLEAYEPDSDPAIWAIRVCGMITHFIANENIDIQEVRTALETLYVMAPDPIINATAQMHSILSQGDNK